MDQISEADEIPQKYYQTLTNKAVIQPPGTLVAPRNFDMTGEPGSGWGMSPHLVKLASVFTQHLLEYPPQGEGI